MQRSTLLFAVVLLVSSLLVLSEARDFDGRATFYTDNTEGSCRYGAPDNNYYAAWPDSLEGAPNCGKCFELQCVNRDFHDGYGQPVLRSDACYDESKKVVVKIIDSCPCVHANFYSNQRWCCGDMQHIDISEEVFKMLADDHWGVIGLKWRETSCDRLGEVAGSNGDSSGGGDSSDGGSSDGGSSDGGSSDGGSDYSDGASDIPHLHEELKDFHDKGYDTTWVKQKVSAFKGLSDDDFKQKWHDTVSSTWLSKIKHEMPERIRSTFGGWRH